MDTLRQTYNRIFRGKQIEDEELARQEALTLMKQRQRAPLDGDLDDEDASNGRNALRFKTI